MPTRPFTLSRSASSISRVTQVDSAMLRADSTTAPTSTMPTNSANCQPPMRSSSARGVTRYRLTASAKAAVVTNWATTITRFLRVRSTQVPNGTPTTAMSSMYEPPMKAVASTERVSRYTQKVSANHR